MLNRFVTFAFVVGAAAAGLPPGLQAQDTLASTLRTIVASAQHPDMRWGGFPDVRADAERVYLAYQWRSEEHTSELQSPI